MGKAQIIENGEKHSFYENNDILGKVLLIARRKGFWTSKVCEVFSHRLFLRAKSTQLEQYAGAILGLILIIIYRPKVVFLSTRTKIIPFYAQLRKIGLLRKIKIMTDCQYLPEEVATQMDKIIVYSKGEIEPYSIEIRNRFVFVSFPSKVELVGVVKDFKISGKYIFCGGSNMRDHNSFIEAVRQLPIEAVIVTDRPLPSNIPNNCHVYKYQPLKDYISLMAGSLFVVVPLAQSKLPHGHSDISIAMSLGKTVISTKGAGVDDYITDGIDGILVSGGDQQTYRTAMQSLLNDRSLFDKLSASAKMRGQDFSYESYLIKLKNIASELIYIHN